LCIDDAFAHAGWRGRSPQDVRGAVRQYDGIARRKRDRAPKTAQLDDTGALGDEVKRRRSV
jgi:hypothetical protein